MTFNTFVVPGVRAFSARMRVKLAREPAVAARATYSSPAPAMNPTHRQVHWRVSPATGQLEQRGSLHEPRDPQRRRF